MTTKEKIIKILNENPNLSGREISKMIGVSRSAVNSAISKMGIKRDRNELRKVNNQNRSFEAKITYEANQIILGSLLGDGSVSKIVRSDNSKLNLNSRLSINHSVVQEDYCLYKSRLLSTYGVKNRVSRLSSREKKCMIQGREIKDNGSIRIETIRSISLNKYRNDWYGEFKVIPPSIYELNELGLAIWYMDDGNKVSHCNAYYLHTECFKYSDIEILCDMLLKNFNIKTSIHKKGVINKDQYCLYIRSESADLFKSLIEKYFCESMKYKLK